MVTKKKSGKSTHSSSSTSHHTKKKLVSESSPPLTSMKKKKNFFSKLFEKEESLEAAAARLERENSQEKTAVKSIPTEKTFSLKKFVKKEKSSPKEEKEQKKKKHFFKRKSKKPSEIKEDVEEAQIQSFLDKKNPVDEIKKKKENEKEKRYSIKQLADKNKKDKKKHIKKLNNRKILRKYLDKSGLEDVDETKFIKRVFMITILVCALLTVISTFIAYYNSLGNARPFLFVLGIWTGIFAGLILLFWFSIYAYLDIKIYQRTQALEEVLPDYLQLASANISAGMPVDRALWFAVRPRFGVLSKEIESVAKSTFSGEDLGSALIGFTEKYDSIVLRRSINLLLEGINSGGELAELLNKIALNIQETRILRKEMSANVTTYAIFISFAAIGAAPVLFGLSGQLLIIIKAIMGLVAESSDGGSGAGGGMFSFDFSSAGEGVTIGDFRIFSIATLLVTALFSSFIVSSIKKGNIKDGMRSIPIFLLVTIVVYVIASWLLSILLGGMIST